jgi:hypothetical protein
MTVRARLARLEDLLNVGEPEEQPMTDEERDRRLRATLELYDERGWQARGKTEADMRQKAILGVLVRAAERVAKEQPSTQTLARAELWRERLAQFEAAPPS